MQNDKLPPRDIVERTFAFAVRIIRLSRNLILKSPVERVLVTQLVKAGTSIGANMEEAQAGQSRADFASKVGIALKEARETRYWLRLIVEARVIGRDELDPLIQEGTEITKILGAIAANSKRRHKL